jgi:serine/threonine protein kinase
VNGVEAAHLQGVNHRDLKPENVLYDEKTNNLAVADFGAADFTEEVYTIVETQHGSVSGTSSMQHLSNAPAVASLTIGLTFTRSV